MSAASSRFSPPPTGYKFDLIYGKFAFTRSLALDGAPETLNKALFSGRIGSLRTAAAAAAAALVEPEPVWLLWNGRSSEPAPFPPEMIRSLNTILLDAYYYQHQKHVLYNAFYEGQLVGAYGYKIVGPIPLQYYDLEHPPKGVVKDAGLGGLYGGPARYPDSDQPLSRKESSSTLTRYRINLDTGLAANVSINVNEPIQNPQYQTGNHETACGFPNVQGYEGIMVGFDRKQSEAIARSQLVRMLVSAMAQNGYSDIEYQCRNMFVEVTTLAYEMLF
ncbi:hypothetical protein BGX33_008255 [Mortierella sp. NVP41]|nr:hypothetical protein BGX33_008255 [Mortierella sp. NVP41]